MAFQTFDAGAVSLAAANWSGAGFGSDAELLISQGEQIINQDLDHSASNIQAFVIGSQFRGLFGDSAASATFDVNNTSTIAEPYFHYLARAGAAFYEPDATCRNLWVNSGGSFFATGGAFTSVAVSRGTFHAKEAAVVTTLRMWGGVGELEANATGVTLAHVMGGARLTTRRDGAYLMTDRSTLIVDHRGGSPDIELTMQHPLSMVILRNGTIDDVVQDAGIIDMLQSLGEVGIGADAYTIGDPRFAKVYYQQGIHTVAAATPLTGGVAAPPVQSAPV